MLEPTQEHQHLPCLQIAPSMVEVCMSNITHYKKLERRHCETIVKIVLILLDSLLSPRTDVKTCFLILWFN